MRSPGIEPGSITWQATIITTRPRTLDKQHTQKNDLRANRTPNLRVWNPTRCHCAMKSYLRMHGDSIEHDESLMGVQLQSWPSG